MTARITAAQAVLLMWAVFFMWAVPLSAAHAGQARIATSGLSATIALTSLKEARFQRVIRQQYDFSCGSAAIATLLTYHYGTPTTEEQAFRSMYAAGDAEAIRKSGFSLADMQRYLDGLGLRSDGYRVSLDKLTEIGIPAITLINTKGYNHFVVIKGIKNGEVLVGDPALGLKSFPKAEFESMWKGVIFVIRDQIEPARQAFNLGDEWSVQRKAPFGTALSRRGLATFSTVLPGLNEF